MSNRLGDSSRPAALILQRRRGNERCQERHRKTAGNMRYELPAGCSHCSNARGAAPKEGEFTPPSRMQELDNWVVAVPQIPVLGTDRNYLPLQWECRTIQTGYQPW